MHVYVPLYGTVPYLIEQVKKMLAVEKDLIKDPAVKNREYVKGRIDALKEVVKEAKEITG